VSDRTFVSPELRARVRLVAVPIALVLGKLGLTPNSLTIVGFLGTCAAAVAAASQAWVLAGLLVLVFGIFDLFDGALARATGRTSKFGAFLDSTLDRTGESLVLAGVAYGLMQQSFQVAAALALLALVFVPVVTYTRAKAESLGVHGEVGIAPRPERLVVLSAGLILGGIGGVCGALDCVYFGESGVGNLPLGLALGTLAVTSAITVIQRILHVRQQLDSKQ
jgi:CDP-diacylglycerol---glycerol-3-phosphate 3-phosphatidyltransferase